MGIKIGCSEKEKEESGRERGEKEKETERYTYYYEDKATANPCGRANFGFLVKFVRHRARVKRETRTRKTHREISEVLLHGI